MSALRRSGWPAGAGTTPPAAPLRPAGLSGLLRLVFLSLFLHLLVLAPSAGLGMTVAWDKGGGSERIGLSFPGTAPAATAARTGMREVTIRFPAGLPAGDRPAPPDLSGSPLLAGVDVGVDRIVLRLRTEAFGFILAREAQSGLAVRVFADAVGARWKPSGGAGAPVSPAAGPATPAPPAEPRGSGDSADADAPGKSATAMDAQAVSAADAGGNGAAAAPAPSGVARQAGPKGDRAPQEAASSKALKDSKISDPKASTGAKAGAAQAASLAPAGSPIPPAAKATPVAPVPASPKDAKTAKGSKAAKGSVNGRGPDTAGGALPAPAEPLPAGPETPQPAQEPGGEAVFPLPPLSGAVPHETEREAVPGGQAEPSRTAARVPGPAYAVRAQVNRGGPKPAAASLPDPAAVPAAQPVSGAAATEAPARADKPAPDAPHAAAPAEPRSEDSGAAQPPRRNASPLPMVDPFKASGRSSYELRRTVSRDIKDGDPAAAAPAPLRAEPPVAAQAAPDPAPAGPAAGQAVAQAPDKAADAVPEKAPEKTPEKTGEKAADKGGEQAADKPADKPEAGHGGGGHGEAKKKPEGPTPQMALDSAKNAMLNGEYESAVKVLESIRNYPEVEPGVREEALYLLAEALFALRHDDLKTYFADVTGAFKEAMNANTKSSRLPTALLGLGYVNLKAGNVPEARAYFNLLKKRFPKDEGVPSIDYYWGEHYYSAGKYPEAAKEFQHLVQTWPDHKLAQQASLGLAKSLSEQGSDKEALQILDYIGKRWPRYYVEYPAFLRLAGDVAFKLKQWDRAKTSYWAYYNLQPNAEDNHVVLARLGDAYAQLGAKDGARGAWSRAAAEHPDSEGGLIARMRLAEEGIFDAPSLDQLRPVFERTEAGPAEAYARIVAEHPESQLAPLAQLKLAMYHLWSKQYGECLGDIAAFERKFPRDPLLKRTTEVAVMAFSQAAVEAVKEGNYGRIADFWNKFGFIQDNRDLLSPEVRLAAAVSLWQAGRRDGLVLVQPMLAPKDRLLEPALDLTLAIHTDSRNWAELARLGEQAQGWTLSEDRRRQLDYAVALARESLGDQAKAQPLWGRLAGDAKLGPDQRAYALFYTARAALDGNDPKRAGQLAQDAQTLFKGFKTPDTPKLKDCAALLMEASQRQGKPAEALKWAEEYDRLVDEGDPEWGASRYRIAQLRLQLGDRAGWKESLDAIAKKAPDSLYGKTAMSALKSESLEKTVQQFSGK